MSLQKQESFLDHIASRLGRPRKTGVRPPEWNQTPYTHLYEGKSQEELIQQFIDSLAALDTKVDRVSIVGLSDVLDAILQKFGIKSALLWDDEQLNRLQLLSLLQNKRIDASKWDKNCSENELREEAAQVDLGITWADMGLAETGSVVLFNGGGRGRVVSLLPPVYLCILSEKTIVPRLTQAVQYIHEQVPVGLPACINFITGPSRTGDIDMELALGVHGPGKVHVILLKD